jgi:hypothetical protein
MSKTALECRCSGIRATLSSRDEAQRVSEQGGRRPYTQEETVKATAHFLAEAEQRWREDAARHRLTLGAVQVELSRLYMDDAIRQKVLLRALEQAGLPVPAELLVVREGNT